jgi:DNA gyrase subunit A
MSDEQDKNIESREITEELKESYLDYAMSVIVARALPDARDGLKPVQRRILWGMWDAGVTADAKFRKAADVVGEVMGKYHPHGDASIYQTIVRMVQDFSFRYPLCIGQGNWGSVDGDEAAAMRYTETKLSRISEQLLGDIDKETVDFVANYSGSKFEPTYLPAKVPNLLLNGTAGIAVGMATNIPPHNLGEVVEATLHLADNPKATTEDLMQFIKGPDFPTGGVIYNKKDIETAYTTGKGPITMRGIADIKERKGGKGYDIEVTEIPYQVNKSELLMKMAELVAEKKVEGIRDIRDESDKNGMSIIIELKNEANPQKVLNRLFEYTDLQKNFPVNMVALTNGGLQPQTMSLRDLLVEFIEHRKLVIKRRAEFDLRKAKEREHILEGLEKALANIDKIIALIRKSESRDEAHANLMKQFKFTDLQAMILSMLASAFSNPSKMCSLSFAFRRSNSARRFITSFLCSMNSTSKSRSDIVCGCNPPFVSATMFTGKFFWRSVYSNRRLRTFCGFASFFSSIIMDIPFLSLSSRMSLIPSTFFSATSSAIFISSSLLFTW